MQIEPDGIRLVAGSPASLRLAFWREGVWQPLTLTAADSGIRGEAEGVRAILELDDAGENGAWAYRLRMDADFPTRLRLDLVLPAAGEAFHLIPACVFGDNNLAHAEPGHFPNLTHDHPENISCAPYWELRADRASLPVSMLHGGGFLLAVSIAPYSPCNQAKTTSREGFIRNGVLAELGGDGAPHACGVTLGYRNTPVSFINKDIWGVPTGHLSCEAEASGTLFLREAASRMAAHGIMDSVYRRMRSVPETPVEPRDAIGDLARAFCSINWVEEKGNFTNQHTRDDPQKKILKPWRTLAEVGWTGGGVIGYPLLAAAHYLQDPEAKAKALHALDWTAKAYNPASGLLWDVCGEREGTGLNWWWSGYIVKDVHCAYTNGSAAYYLLKSARFLQRHGLETRPAYAETACKALDTICGLQLPDGNFGYTYSAKEPAVLDREGFAGVWFVPALALAYLETGKRKYLEAAERGIRHYHAFVQDLNCWGTPMDTWKSLEQEGNLGFMRGAHLLHEISGDDTYLGMLDESARYEYLWRYGFRARPEFPPLKGSHWNSCGGSVTSVSNPHIHPMGIFVNRELRYLAATTRSELHRMRYEDGVAWALNAVSLYPGVSGYGERGVLTERFCPSDGLTIESFPDGSPSSLWFSYNGWAAAAVLEGLVEIHAD